MFCLINDLYREMAPEHIRLRPQHGRIQFSDAEVLTLSVMQGALSDDSERSFHRSVSKNYRHLFPRLLSHDRYHRRRKALWKVQEMLFARLAARLSKNARWLVVDSAPVETAKFARSQSARRSIPEGEYGWIPSQKRVFFGLRLHALVTDCGVVVGFVLSSANASEREAAEEMLAEHAGQAVLADNGYCGAPMAEAARRRGHTVSASPKPSRKPASRAEAKARRWLRAKRDLIESVFGVLADQFKIDQFNIETTRARSLWGAGTRVVAKLLAFNLSIHLNRMIGRPDLAIKSLYL